MGATGFAYDLARQFGLKVVEPRPALVPLTLGGEDVLFRELSGVAADVIARCGKTAFRRGRSLHPSRTVRPGDLADILLLAQRRGGSGSTFYRSGKPAGLKAAKAKHSERHDTRSAARCAP